MLKTIPMTPELAKKLTDLQALYERGYLTISELNHRVNDAYHEALLAHNRQKLPATRSLADQLQETLWQITEASRNAGGALAVEHESTDIGFLVDNVERILDKAVVLRNQLQRAINQRSLE